MKMGQILIAAIACAASCLAQLTQEQKLADFNDLAATFDKNYGPYEWKRDAIGFDLLRIGPWLDRVKATRTDLEFYEVMSKYVASLVPTILIPCPPRSRLASVSTWIFMTARF